MKQTGSARIGAVILLGISLTGCGWQPAPRPAWHGELKTKLQYAVYGDNDNDTRTIGERRLEIMREYQRKGYEEVVIWDIARDAAAE